MDPATKAARIAATTRGARIAALRRRVKAAITLLTIIGIAVHTPDDMDELIAAHVDRDR